MKTSTDTKFSLTHHLYSLVQTAALSIFEYNLLLYPAPSRRGHKAMMLSDVCLSRTSGLNREQSGLGRLKLAQR